MPEEALTQAPLSGNPAPAPPPSTPKAPSTPAPKAPSSPRPTESPYDEIDRLVSESQKPVKQREEKVEATKEAPKEPEPEAKTEVPTETPEKGAETPAKQPDKSPEKPFKAAELRTAYENLKKEHQSLKTELEKAKTAKPQDDQDKPKLVESLTAKDKQIAELQEKLKYASYEQSDEYQKKYHEPFLEAYESGRKRTAALTVTNPDGTERKAGPEDFDAIMRISDDNIAGEKAAEMFGAKASIVLYHRERVQELNGARYKAIEVAKQSAGERSRAEMEERAKQQAAFEKQRAESTETFNRLNKEAIEKYPQWFKPDENDDEGNKLLEQGFRTADLMFANVNLPPEKIVALHSAVRNKAAGFDRLAYKLHKTQARVKELEGELEAFKKSGPGEAGDAGRQPTKKSMSWDEEIDSIAR